MRQSNEAINVHIETENKKELGVLYAYDSTSCLEQEENRRGVTHLGVDPAGLAPAS